MNPTFSEVSASCLAQYPDLLFVWFPNGVMEGREFCVGSLRGEPGRSLKVNAHSGVWCDFSSGEAGRDPVSLWAAMRGISQGDALRELVAGKSFSATAEAAYKPRKQTVELWESIGAPTHYLPLQFPRHFKYGKPNEIYKYHTPSGGIYGYVCRFNIKKKIRMMYMAEFSEVIEKEIIPLSWCRNRETGALAWRWKAFKKPRPLYKLPEIHLNTHHKIIVVEGEKCADAIRKLEEAYIISQTDSPFFHFIGTTWPGGARAIQHADWTPLHGRDIILWPDNDLVGFEAMHHISKILQGKANISWIKIPSNKPQGWDAADALKEGMDISRFLY